MAGIKIAGGDGSNSEMTVDSVGNANVTLPQVTTPAGVDGTANVGSVRMFTEIDPGVVTGTALVLSPETSQDFRLRVGMDTVVFRDTFNASAQNTDKWLYTFVTLTAAQSGNGAVSFSNVQGTTSAHGAFMRTGQYFPMIGTAPLAIEFTLGQFTAALVTNEVWRCGLGLPTAAVTPPTDGCWFELTTAGLTGVAMFNSSPNSLVLIPLSDMVVGSSYKLVMVVGETRLDFWRDDVLLGSINKAAGNGQLFQQPALPIFLMKYNTGNVSNTNTMRVSDVTASLMDLGTNKAWIEQLGTQGNTGAVGQNGHTMGQTCQWANAALPTAAAGTNTTAALGSGLGGLFQLNAPATSATDIVISSYQNPVPTINLTGRNLLIKGVWVDCTNLVTAVATTATTFAVALAIGHTAASLATPETGSFVTATTKAPRRIPLGNLYFPVATPVGGGPSSGRIFIQFAGAQPVYPGQFVAIIAKPLVGTATATETFLFTIGFDAYPE